MAVRRKSDVNYGLNQPLNIGAPRPIIANRDPGASDFAELGTTWVNPLTNGVFVITSIVSGAATWSTSPASGVGVFTDVTITGGVGTVLDVQAGDVSIGAGNLAVVGDTTMTGNLSVVGDFALTGDFDIVDTGSISLTSTNNAAQAIYLHADGGVLETIDIHSDQGTAVNSVNIHSDVGGLTLASGLASADAINLAASAGGVDIDGALQVNIASSQAAADAIRVVASNAAGGIDIDAGTAGAAIDSTGALSLQGAAASDFSVSGAGIDLSLVSAAGRVIVNGEEAAADAITLLSAAGGLDTNVALQMNLDSSQVAADAIRLLASDAAGGIDIDAGTGGITIDSTGAISVEGAAASDLSVSGAGIDLTLASAAGRVVINAEEAAANAITLLSAAGGLDANVALQMNLDSSQAAADAVRIIASDAAGGIDVDAGTAGIAIDSTGAVSIQGAAASDFSVSGAGIDLTLASAAGRVVVNGEEAAADAVRILSAAGGLDVDVALQMNLDSSQAAGTAVRINASDAAGGIDIDAGTGGITIDSTGAVSIQGAAGSDFSVSGAGVDFSIVSAAGRVVLDGGEAAADAIDITASNAAGGVAIDSGTAGVAISATGGPVSLTAGVGSNGTVTLTSTGTGDIILDSDDTMLLDADGVLELNSSAGAISIGNDADAQAINIGTAGVRPIQVGNASAGTTVLLLGPANVGVTLQNSIRIMTGAGSPDTVVTAPAGSLWLRTDPAGATSRIYVNTDSATAWTNVTCAA